MLKPNPIIERAVRIHAINVLSDAIIVRSKARSVRSSARTVPLSFSAPSTGSMRHSSGGGFCRDGCFFRGWGRRTLRCSSHTCNQSAQNQVGHYRQDEGDDERFPRIYKAVHDDLVYDVQHHRENEYSADTLPPVLEHVDTLGVIREEAPEVRRLASPGICQPRANGEERRHARLEHQSELHRPADAGEQLTSNALPHVIHNVP